MFTRNCSALSKCPIYNISSILCRYRLNIGVRRISSVRNSIRRRFSGNPWWRCNQHRFTPGDSISRSPKKQSRVINKETRSRCPKLAWRVRFPHGIALCSLYSRGCVSLHCGWLFHAADYCRPIIVAAK